MNLKNIQNLIIAWYEKARRENDHYSKFVFLWICFNAWLDYRSGKDTDSEMIKWLVSQSAQNSDLVRQYENSKNNSEFIDSLKSLANMSPFNDTRGKPPIIIADKNDFENIVWAIYRIRCNLFHGSSGAHEDRSLKEVFLSKNILNIWVGNVILEW